MNFLNAAMWAYAGFVALMGTLGFVLPISRGEDGSPISMVAGIALAAVVATGILLSKNRPALGYGICGLGALLVLGRFAPQFLQDTSKVFPHAVMIVGSVVALAILAYFHFFARGKVSTA